MTQSIMMHNASARRAPVSRGPERTYVYLVLRMNVLDADVVAE